MKKMILTCVATLTLGLTQALAQTAAAPTAAATETPVAVEAATQPKSQNDWRSMIRRVKKLKDDTGINGFLDLNQTLLRAAFVVIGHRLHFLTVDHAALGIDGVD